MDWIAQSISFTHIPGVEPEGIEQLSRAHQHRGEVTAGEVICDRDRQEPSHLRRAHIRGLHG